MRDVVAVEVEVGSELHATSFDYPDRTVELHFYRCAILGDPKPVLGQRMRWVSRAELTSLRFPPADLELVRIITDPGTIAPASPSGRGPGAC